MPFTFKYLLCFNTNPNKAGPILRPSLEDTYSEKPQGGGGHQIQPFPQILKS